jgi:DNA topoisomerase II
VLSSPIIQ